MHIIVPRPIWDETSKARLDAHFKEYAALREEALKSMDMRNQIINFGLAVLGVLILSALTTETKTYYLIRWMFDFVIPIVAVIVYVNWLGEFERMVRAGTYLRKLENRINEILGNKILRWQHDVKRMRMGYSYLVIAALFLGIAAGAPWLGGNAEDPVRPVADLLIPQGTTFGNMIETAWVSIIVTVTGILISVWRIRRMKSYDSEKAT